MAVGALNRAGAAYRPQANAKAAPKAAAATAAKDGAAEAAPKPEADGVVRSEAAKAGYKAWLKGRMKSMFEDIIATATKRH